MMTTIEAFNDPVLLKDCPAGIFEPDKNFDPKKRTLLIYLSCHGRTLMDYFRTRRDLLNEWNVLRFETGPMLIAVRAGIDVFKLPSTRAIFGMADAVFTYNMGDRHGCLALNKVLPFIKRSAKVVTMVAPNCSCFSPMAYAYCADLGVMNAFDSGKTEEQVFNSFKAGAFDPMFNVRWRIEIGRLADKESYHDVGLAAFVVRNYRKQKLWMAAAHPTYTTMAYLGNECLSRIGLKPESEEAILSYDYTIGAIGGQPETQYEFKHFRLEYPMRHEKDAGGIEYYRSMITNFAAHWRSGGLISTAWD